MQKKYLGVIWREIREQFFYKFIPLNLESTPIHAYLSVY